jgi:hypothetical protein
MQSQSRPVGLAALASGLMILGLVTLGLLALAPRQALAADATGPGIPQAGAARVFEEAKAICGRDRGRLWSHSLCGPIMLVEPAGRTIAANQADLHGALRGAGAIFTGVLPASETLANSPARWSGVYWTEILRPLPEDEATRHVLIAHELFHRIQPDLDMPREDGDNAHLDTLEGRYLLQLEWRALARALQADGPQARRRAALDALAFRAERYRLFPAAADNERALELNEGVAEYTGVRLGLTDPKARTAYAVGDLTDRVGDPTFVRSFAYATGPAYGLLLDLYAPNWRGRLKSRPRLDALLQAALPAAADAPAPSLEARAAAYDGASLRAAEVEREAKRQALLASLRARLVDGPVLHIPARKISYEFNPRALQPLDDLGTVYPHIRLTGAFGVLEADKGALLNKDHSEVTVSAAGADLKALKGDGWSLTLQPGWTVKPGPRKGDWVAAPPTTP